MTLVDAITWLYGASGVAILASYAPQVRLAWRSRQGAKDVSLATWGFWCCTALVSVLYATVVVKDRGFALMATGNMVGCIAVTAITAWRRLQFVRQGRHEALHASNVAPR